MLPWFFLFDHNNYALWLSVHVKDLEELADVTPDIHNQFLAGKFVIHETGNPFSAITVNQAHEQLNAIVKRDGGAMGLMAGFWCFETLVTCRTRIS